MIDALRLLRDRGVDVPEQVLAGASVEPPYFDELAETVARMLRRPRDAQRLLRYIEWWGQVQIGLRGPSVVEALGAPYADYTRKLVSDVGRMCFRAAGLSTEWVALATKAGNGTQHRADDDETTQNEDTLFRLDGGRLDSDRLG
jgi:hypothetical protein